MGPRSVRGVSQNWRGGRWSSLWGDEACEGVSRNARGGHMRALASGPSVGIPTGPQRVRSVPRWVRAKMGAVGACERCPWGHGT
eukprot:4269842-Pyramimonas_sp.AAC.1